MRPLTRIQHPLLTQISVKVKLLVIGFLLINGEEDPKSPCFQVRFSVMRADLTGRAARKELLPGGTRIEERAQKQTTASAEDDVLMDCAATVIYMCKKGKQCSGPRVASGFSEVLYARLSFYKVKRINVVNCNINVVEKTTVKKGQYR
nr:hypothetical protein [uncultured Desulfobulbus sp.]